MKLQKERARALETRHDDRARGAPRTLGEKKSGRIRYLRQSLLAHLEHADFVGGTEAVLDRPQEAVGVVLLPFEVQHGVHEMLEDTGPRDGAILGHMAHEEGGNPAPLREKHETGRALPHLAHAAGRRLQPG